MRQTIEEPDYIIADNKHKNTGLVIKRISSDTGSIQLVLRICTTKDEPGYKSSVISCWCISDKRLRNYLRNKLILYKKRIKAVLYSYTCIRFYPNDYLRW